LRGPRFFLRLLLHVFTFSPPHLYGRVPVCSPSQQFTYRVKPRLLSYIKGVLDFLRSISWPAHHLPVESSGRSPSQRCRRRSIFFLPLFSSPVCVALFLLVRALLASGQGSPCPGFAGTAADRASASPSGAASLERGGGSLCLLFLLPFLLGASSYRGSDCLRKFRRSRRLVLGACFRWYCPFSGGFFFLDPPRLIPHSFCPWPFGPPFLRKIVLYMHFCDAHLLIAEGVSLVENTPSRCMFVKIFSRFFFLLPLHVSPSFPLFEAGLYLSYLTALPLGCSPTNGGPPCTSLPGSRSEGTTSRVPSLPSAASLILSICQATAIRMVISGDIYSLARKRAYSLFPLRAPRLSYPHLQDSWERNLRSLVSPGVPG